ncbi:hypothetical protein SAICODRAFT_119542 [Saitoella complicata NRRL Y-17804]|uniref:uncharacterized protein n=1 Tax=Saitoella complicata (strain BCRC 22490 / CBS 7301 / JCM 7358 / NBRC 10748 / NRRL Y-17804) TaxID=698492 RepID=UPI000866F8C7|nr:uncharacterized protein SAICODRAFT_119542 [Saitoella complicata NRRL Y-17804]ODQ53255.1 hypothetical protein SAICODRAFT_119542 [Saitoella complicata NRRL Y-17804]
MLFRMSIKQGFLRASSSLLVVPFAAQLAHHEDRFHPLYLPRQSHLCHIHVLPVTWTRLHLACLAPWLFSYQAC